MSVKLESDFVNQWIGILGAVALIVGLIFLLRSGANSAVRLEQELHRLCRGDREMMGRLISYEEKRGNGRSRKAAIRAAIDSYKRDNR